MVLRLDEKMDWNSVGNYASLMVSKMVQRSGPMTDMMTAWRLLRCLVENLKTRTESKRDYRLGPMKDEMMVWRLVRCLVRCLVGNLAAMMEQKTTGRLVEDLKILMETKTD